MALKYGSSSKSNNFKRSAFPMQSGTSNHTSAVKQVKEEEKSLDVQYAEFEKEKETNELRDKYNKLRQSTSDAETKTEVVKSSKTEKLEGKVQKTKTKKAYKESDQFKADKKEFNKSDKTNWNKFKKEKRNEFASDPDNAETIKGTKSKKSGRQQGKLDKSTMVDAMNPEEKMEYEQGQKDDKATKIRNTIATIDAIMPKLFGGGQGASRRQTLDDKPTYTDDSFWADANKGGKASSEERAGTESTSIKASLTDKYDPNAPKITGNLSSKINKKSTAEENSPNKDIGPMGMFKKKVNKELETPAGQLAVKAATGGIA